MTTGGMQVPPRVSIRGQYAVLRQIRWCAAVQTPMNCHCKLEVYPVRDVEPVKFTVQCLTQAAIKLPSAGDNARQRSTSVVICVLLLLYLVVLCDLADRASQIVWYIHLLA